MLEKEGLCARHTMVLITLFLFGSSIVIGININATVEQDSWICLILSFLFIIPQVLILARLIKIFPGKNIYEIFDILFGKIVGKLFSFIFVLHVLYFGTVILRNFTEFVEITTLSETPMIPIMIPLIITTIYLAKSGMNTLGRWGNVILLVLSITVSATVFLGIPAFNVQNLQPVWGHPSKSIFISAFGIFMIPFAELIVIMGMADELKIKNKEKSVFLLGTTIAGIILLTLIVRNIMVLGVPMLKNSFFASYQTARILQLGDFLTRIEGVITINLILGGMTKGTVFLISISKGVAHLTGNKNYKSLIVPLAIVALGICPFLFEDVVDMFKFPSLFEVYTIPVQVILPIVLWILAEVHIRRRTKKTS